MAGWTEDVRREVLPNGLTLLAQRIPGAPAVAVVSAVRAGFFDEPDRLAGVSHILEHMLFKGTPTRGVSDIPRETRSAGGSLNAGTGYDHTSYITILPPAALRIGLDLQSDALRRSLIDEDELRRELIVIIEEAKRKLDSAASVAGEALHQLLFDHHRIRRWRIGTEEQLRGVTRADVAEFWQSYYVPGETVVALTGELFPDEACAMAREYFADWPPMPSQRDRSPVEPEWSAVRSRTIRGDVTAADLALGWRTVGRLHPDALALDLAAMVLSSGRSSWLYRGVRVPGAMTSVGASHFTPREVGVFSIGGELDPGKLPEALGAVGKQVQRLRDSGPDSNDLERIRTLLRAGWARRLESAEGRASALASAEMDGDYRLLDREYSRLLVISAEEIQLVAREWLDPNRIAGVVYLPEGKGEDLDAGLLKDAFAPVASVPVSRAAPTGPPDELLRIALPGVTLLLKHRPGVPLVSLGLYQRRHRAETRHEAGLAALAVRAAVRGAGDLDAGELALAFERLGGVLGPVVASEWFGFATSVLSIHAEAAVRLLDLVFRTPRFSPEEIGQEQKTLLESVIQDADDMSRYPVELAFRARFGPEGYGLPVQGVPESVGALDAAKVAEWHREALTAPRRQPVLIAVGDFDADRLGERLSELLGSFPPRQEDWSPIAGDPATRSDRILAEERAKRQTALAMMFPGPTRNAPERFAAEVWAAIAGGLGGRLFVALRDRLSLAYVVRASVWQRGGAGAILAYLATSPEREEEALAAMGKELRRFADEPVPGEELDRAIRFLTGQILIGRQTVGAVAGEIAEAWLARGEAGLEELRDPTAGIQAVTAASVQQVAQTAFDEERSVLGIIRGVAEPAMLRNDHQDLADRSHGTG